MGLLTFALNVTLDGCCDHREGIADDELHDYFTQLMDAAGAMLYGRTTYELMESATGRRWRATRRRRARMREWARKLEAIAEVRGVGLAPRLPVEQHLPRRGGAARGREAAQGEDPARRARGQPHALGRARAAGADRRVPSRRPPGPRRPRADLVSGPGALAAPRARLDEAPEVRRDGAALPPPRGDDASHGARLSAPRRLQAVPQVKGAKLLYPYPPRPIQLARIAM